MKRDNIIKWIGTLLTAAGSTIIAFSPVLAAHSIPFFAYLVGAILWLWMSIKYKEWSLAALNVFFVAIDFYAIIIRW